MKPSPFNYMKTYICLGLPWPKPGELEAREIEMDIIIPTLIIYPLMNMNISGPPEQKGSDLSPCRDHVVFDKVGAWVTEENIQSTLKLLPQIYLGINWYHYLVGNTGYCGRLNSSNFLLWLQKFLDSLTSLGRLVVLSYCTCARDASWRLDHDMYLAVAATITLSYTTKLSNSLSRRPSYSTRSYQSDSVWW